MKFKFNWVSCVVAATFGYPRLEAILEPGGESQFSAQIRRVTGEEEEGERNGDIKQP